MRAVHISLEWHLNVGRTWQTQQYPQMHWATGGQGHYAYCPGSTLNGRRHYAHYLSRSKLVPVVVAAALFGGYWKGKLVAFSVDNQAVVEIINKSHSKESHLMHLIRLLTFYACHYGFEFRAEHIPGKRTL